jgi:predicted ATP-dependent protease
VTRVLLPAANAKDLDELPEQVKAELAIVLVRTLEEALPLALEPLSHKEPLEEAKEAHEVAADEQQQQQQQEQQQTGPMRGVLASRL